MELKLTLTRNCNEEVIKIKPDEETEIGNVSAVVDENGNKFNAININNEIIAIVTEDAGEHTFEICEGESDTLKVVENEETIDVLYNGKVFASYNFSSELKKPFLGPILNKSGNSFTRCELHNPEHPHQRSVFLGIGNVNGVELWNEPEDSGYIEKGKPYDIEVNNVYASFKADNIWCDKDGSKLMNETRKATFYNQSEDCRYIDFEFTFFAEYGDVTFGQTKEAGPLGVRVNPEITVKNGGKMTNCYGANGEKECWSKQAHWCLYGGKIQGDDCAIAVFDNSQNERFPTNWHIRDYGLFAANNLHFRGEVKIPEGESLTYKYRLCFFNNEGNDVGDRYINYSLN